MESENVIEYGESNNLNKSMIRAAEISSLICSLTLGPNANFEDNEINNKIVNGNESDPKNTILKKCSNNKMPQITTSNFEKSSKMDINDVKNLQQQLLKENTNKKIEIEVRKKLEHKRLEEIEKHKQIRSNLEALKAEAERRHKLRMIEFDRQVQRELELERQRELAYQEQRKQLAANTRKIQEEKEKLLREQIRKWIEISTKQEDVFTKMLSICNSEFKLLDTYKKELKSLQTLRDANINSLEILKSVCVKLDALSQKFQKDLTEFATAKREAEEKEREKQLLIAAAQKQQQEKEIVTPIQIAAVTPQSHDQIDQIPSADTNLLLSESFKQFNDYMQLLAMKKAQTKRLDDTPELQQIRFALKSAVNFPINLLNEKNKTTLIDGYQKLFNLLSGQRVNTAKGSVSILDHNEASDWCKLRIAEKLIDRCDKESNIVFYSAAIAISLWTKFPDFGEIFKGLLYKECPFLMPHKPTKQSTQTNEEFLSTWGFRITNGICESHAHYEGRINKFAALMAAMWINFPRGEAENPFNIRNGWEYLAKVLNNPPDTNYLHIIGKILEIAGFMLHKVYGKQFIKMMILIRDKYIPSVHSSIDEENIASFNRLRETVTSFFNNKAFTPPEGFLTFGYW
ncbi:hypothetical protein PVAND_008205 [Polypedilum vanderplanki]|uniref:mRNA export factor GLE1 n=1 Tax=Polypedilum vanderplanki TaxID=319348 RepID=A0A9J6C916_POLVA|nr:hypothetical protein PVAND_008205 [Polypedilum vanderplanki]